MYPAHNRFEICNRFKICNIPFWGLGSGRALHEETIKPKEWDRHMQGLVKATIGNEKE